jgi:hypothetical protein
MYKPQDILILACMLYCWASGHKEFNDNHAFELALEYGFIPNNPLEKNGVKDRMFSFMGEYLSSMDPDLLMNKWGGDDIDNVTDESPERTIIEASDKDLPLFISPSGEGCKLLLNWRFKLTDSSIYAFYSPILKNIFNGLSDDEKAKYNSIFSQLI